MSTATCNTATIMKWIALTAIVSLVQGDLSNRRRLMGTKSQKAILWGGSHTGHYYSPAGPTSESKKASKSSSSMSGVSTKGASPPTNPEPESQPYPPYYYGKGKGASGVKAMSAKGGKGSKHYYPISHRPPKKAKVPRQPDCATCSSLCTSVGHIFLTDSSRNQRLFAIRPGETLNFDFLEPFYDTTEFSIECAGLGNVGSMLLSDNHGTQTIDNEAPFILAGKSNGDYFDSQFRQNPGVWTVTCQPFCEDDAQGEAGPPAVISFIVEPDNAEGPSQAPGPVCDECQTGCVDVIGFVLVDAATNTQIREISPGDTISVGPNDQFTVECITTPIPFATTPFAVGSVVLTDNYENISPRIDNLPPYALAGDVGGNYLASDFFRNPGPWDISCQAFCGSGGTGESGPVRSMGFTVVAIAPGTPPTPPAPTPQTPPAPTLPPPTPPAPTPPAPSPPVGPSPTSSPTLDCSVCQTGCIFATQFLLVNAATDTRIREIVEGETIQVSPTDSFAIECITDPDPFVPSRWRVGSTVLSDNHEEERNSENSPPWVLADDNNGDYFESPLFEYPGEWIVTCQAFCGSSQTGDSSEVLVRTFNVERAI